MRTFMNAKCAKITYLMVINALLVSTCLGAGSINDQGMKIRDANPSLEHSGAAATSQHAKLSRKLLAPKAWTTLWADEFDSWDSTKWSYHFGDGCQINLCGWGNNELEYYTSSPNNVRVAGGTLTIEAKEVTGTEQAAVQQDCWDECGRRCVSQGYVDGTPELNNCVQACGNNRCPTIRFTSGRISTVNKFSISPSAKYSTIRIEARIQLTPGTGLWPAFWMLPQDFKYGPWPNSGEIDVMESQTAMKAVNGTIHYGGSGDLHQYTSVSTSISPGFHVFRTDWSERDIKWYVDDNFYGAMANKGHQGWFSSGAVGSQSAPFGAGDNFYLLLNMAVGGAYPGNPSADSVSQSMAAGSKQMIVDYVRVMGQ